MALLPHNGRDQERVSGFSRSLFLYRLDEPHRIPERKVLLFIVIQQVDSVYPEGPVKIPGVIQKVGQPDKQKLFSRLIAGKPAEYAFWRRRPDICWRYAGGLYNRKCLCFSRLTGFESLLNALACSGIFDLSHETVERLRSRGTDPVKQDHGLFFQPEPFGAPCFPIEKLACQLPFGF